MDYYDIVDRLVFGAYLTYARMCECVIYEIMGIYVQRCEERVIN